MLETLPIRRALISVYHKDGLDHIIRKLHEEGVELVSTGGTRKFIQELGFSCTDVEELTGYPSIFGGRVKTLHPAVFGGILSRRDNEGDANQMQQYSIKPIDLVIVDLYPFEETVASGASEQDIIEKIDIGGISLIRAAAKNFKDVVIIPSKAEYAFLAGMLDRNGAASTGAERHFLAMRAFAVSSGYDSAIFNWFSSTEKLEPGKFSALRIGANGAMSLRYGENPHQSGCYYGDFDSNFHQLHGKEISYNNLLDIDAAVQLIDDFQGTTACAILKHNNACGLAVRGTLRQAWEDALSADPVSAFGGVIVTNTKVDAMAAAEMGKIFFEVLIAPEFDEDALVILKQKKNRILLQRIGPASSDVKVRSVLGGYLVQDQDAKVESKEDLKLVSGNEPSDEQVADMIFANKIVKHSKSNAIVLARNMRLISSGVGQTSRVDALRQAIDKAHAFNQDLTDAVMASDAFFPFADCVEIAHQAGVTSVIQPGGSIRDTDSVDYCRANNITMVMTGFRHFRH